LVGLPEAEGFEVVAVLLGAIEVDRGHLDRTGDEWLERLAVPLE
jgi:hypothetical protein